MSDFKFQVAIKEYERGWGSKTLDIESFDTYEEAVTRIREVNSHNGDTDIPDWYIIAKALNFEII